MPDSPLQTRGIEESGTLIPAAPVGITVVVIVLGRELEGLCPR